MSGRRTTPRGSYVCMLGPQLVNLGRIRSVAFLERIAGVGFEVSKGQCLSAGWEVGKDVKLLFQRSACLLSAVIMESPSKIVSYSPHPLGASFQNCLGCAVSLQ